MRDLQVAPEGGGIITLLHIDLRSQEEISNGVTGEHLYFTELPEEVRWGGNTYIPFPYHPPRYEVTDKLPKLVLEVANVDKMMYSIIDSVEELRMRTIHIYYTFYEYLDDGTNTAGFDSGAYYYQKFYIDSIEINNMSARLTLISPMEFMDIKLPRNHFYKNHCRHIYKGSRCKYNGSLESCDYTFNDCDRHHNTINYGGFRSTGTPFYY